MTQQLGAVTMTPARQLTPEETLGLAAANMERAEMAVQAQRQLLHEAVLQTASQLTVSQQARQIGCSRMAIYNILKAAQ
jgi:hypothetical protein